MSKQKSTKTETQRFSGPELSELLDQVARQHGPDAAIQAVNKIRSGGVAGFFCREEFEVVVHTKVATKAPAKAKKAPAPAVAANPAPAGTTAAGDDAAAADGAHVKQPAANRPKSDIALGRQEPSEPLSRPRSDIAPASAHAVAPQGPAAPAIPAAPVTPASPMTPPSTEPTVDPVQPSERVFAGPRPVIASETQDRFRALLEQRLDDASEAEFDLSEHLGSSAGRSPQQTGRSAPAMRRATPAPVMPSEPSLAPIVPAPGLPISQETVSGGAGVGVLTPVSLITDDIKMPEFWLRLQQVKHELASFMPLASASVATIGPLSLTTPIVRRLRTRPGLESADVIVLTDRAEIVSEPSWKLVRSGHQLVDAVLEQGEWPTLILIDVPVELPNWVAPLENRLRIAGVGLFRYAVPGNPTAEQLDNYRLGSDVPYVIDLISRVRPESLVEFIEQRHPIASVSGADLNAELLMAMREQVALGT